MRRARVEGLGRRRRAIHGQGPTLLGFVAARIAEARDGVQPFHAERARQVAWLRARLRL